ncbi:hypothetical protein TNCV_40441 [Trichonephila clavipes]|nr:hypothetical protein TNCV_40441 [Trichonephila clavipes]
MGKEINIKRNYVVLLMPPDRQMPDQSPRNSSCCQVLYSPFGLAIHPNDHQARRRFVEWAQNKIAVVPNFHKRILFSDEAHLWLNGYVNQQNCRIWSEANPQVYVETPLHPEKLTVCKDCVYAPLLPADHPGLRHMIEAAVARITSDTLNEVWDELAYRLDVCYKTNWNRIDHL